MAEVAPPPAAAALRRELDFVKSLLKSGRSIDEMVAAANAASRVAARAVEETRRSVQKEGTELTLRGLPTGGDWDWRALKRWLQSRGIGQRAIKFTEKDVDSDVGVVRFANESECSTAADMLATCEPPVRGGRVVVERGMAPEYSDRSRKRGREGEEEGGPPGAAQVPKAPRAPDVCEAVCPWWQVPYSKQLTDKHARIAGALGQITAEVNRRTYGAAKPEWVRAVRAQGDSAAAAPPSGPSPGPLCCPLLGILRSPALEHYRNKSEFTAGLDEREQPEVGFLRGAFQDGITCVGNPATTRHTSITAIKLAAAAVNYIRNVSQFPVYDKRRQEGYWRLVLVREGSHRSFVPVPVPATAAAAVPATLDNPTFASLDPFTYLVTFGSPTTPESIASAPAASAAAAAEASVTVSEAEAAAPASDPMATDPPAAAATTSHDAATHTAPAPSPGMHISHVSEAEPERPAPDEVLVLLQVNHNYTRALAEPAATARELRGMAAALAQLPLSTVRVQYHSGVSNAAPYDAPLLELPAAVGEEEGDQGAVVAAVSGPGYIHDALCELKFRISPTAFFQVNSPATCALYKVVGEWAAPRPSTLLLDICCGTGTIGLTMASRVAKVVGVDSVTSAVEDARVNAALNGITNAEFVAGKAEDALPGILAAHAGNPAYSDVVAVADPPRAGLHKTVVRALLGCEHIRRLVFVSCNPDNLVANVAALCSPPDNRSGRDRGGPRGGRGRGRYGGSGREEAGPAESYTPFRPVKALAVDLFPHTAHVEAVMLLER